MRPLRSHRSPIEPAGRAMVATHHPSAAAPTTTTATNAGVHRSHANSATTPPIASPTSTRRQTARRRAVRIAPWASSSSGTHPATCPPRSCITTIIATTPIGPANSNRSGHQTARRARNR